MHLVLYSSLLCTVLLLLDAAAAFPKYQEEVNKVSVVVYLIADE